MRVGPLLTPESAGAVQAWPVHLQAVGSGYRLICDRPGHAAPVIGYDDGQPVEVRNLLDAVRLATALNKWAGRGRCFVEIRFSRRGVAIPPVR